MNYSNVILPTYIGQLLYTTPDELNNIDSGQAENATLSAHSTLQSKTIKQLHLTDLHGKSISTFAKEDLFKRPIGIQDTYMLSPRDTRNLTGICACCFFDSIISFIINVVEKAAISEGKGVIVESNSGRRVVDAATYIQLATRWRADILIAIADEVNFIHYLDLHGKHHSVDHILILKICSQKSNRKRILKAIERSKQWFLECKRLLVEASKIDDTSAPATQPYTPIIFGIAIFNPFALEEYVSQISWLIDSGAQGIVVSCHLGEDSSQRLDMIARAKSVTNIREIPIIVQGCDTLNHVGTKCKRIIEVSVYLFAP